MNGKILILTLVLFVFLLITTSAAAQDEQNQTSVLIGDDTGHYFTPGELVTENCTLYGNLNINTKHGLRIQNDNIAINGNGHSLLFIGNHPDSEAIVIERAANVTITNLSIINFCFGIYSQDSEYLTIDNIVVSYTVGAGIWLDSNTHCTLQHNTIGSGESGHGIFISTESSQIIVDNNTVTTANAKGVCIENSNYISLTKNSLCGNQRGDLLIENSSSITGDYNTATTLVGHYNDTTNGTPFTYSCNTASSINLSQFEGIIITDDYTLKENLSFATGHGLIIASNNITIDGAGYRIDGVESGDCSGSGIQRSGILNMGFDNVVIKNLEVTSFANGIYLRGDKLNNNPVYNNTIENCEIHHNGNGQENTTATHGIKLEYVIASRVINCSVHDNQGSGDSCESGGNGIFLYESSNNFIMNNLVYDNAKGGIFSKMKSSFNKISTNTVTGNGQGGITLRCKLSRFSVIENNNIENNKGSGIYVGGPSNTLMYNTIDKSLDDSIYESDAAVANGIRISREAHFTTLVSNMITNSSQEDIWVQEDLHATGYNNTYNSSENYKKSWGMKLESTRITTNNHQMPTYAPTPLMATLMVILAVIVLVAGFVKNKTEQFPKTSSKKKQKKN